MFQRVTFYGASVKCVNFCVFYVVFMWCFGVWFLLFCSSIFCLVLFFKTTKLPFSKLRFGLLLFYYWFNVKCIGFLFGLYFIGFGLLVIIYCLLFIIGSTQSIKVQQIVFWFIQKCFYHFVCFNCGRQLLFGVMLLYQTNRICQPLNSFFQNRNTNVK